jgi:hypothetical protein
MGSVWSLRNGSSGFFHTAADAASSLTPHRYHPHAYVKVVVLQDTDVVLVHRSIPDFEWIRAHFPVDKYKLEEEKEEEGGGGGGRKMREEEEEEEAFFDSVASEK